MQMTSLPFWLMIVSTATAVLPVWRSPMINSRCPRPIGHHRVDRLQAGLQRLLHRAAIDDAWRQPLDLAELLRDDRALPVDRLTERVDDAADHLFADRHRDDAVGSLDRVAFLDFGVLAEQHRADAFFLEVQSDAEHPVREFQHLPGHRSLDAVDAGDAVANRHDRRRPRPRRHRRRNSQSGRG